MAKIITLPELAAILTAAANSPEDDDQAMRLTEKLSEICIEEFGGFRSRGEIDHASFIEKPDGGWTCAVGINHSGDVPEGGGVWRDYDTDVTVEEWASHNPELMTTRNALLIRKEGA